MPKNYQALMALEQQIFDTLCTVKEVPIDEMQKFEEDFASAKMEYPDLFGPEEVAGTNLRAPHFKVFTATMRAKSFLALELGIDLEEYEKAKKEAQENKS